MSEIVGDTQCPNCKEHGRDKTNNHLILFEDGGAYCNRCGYTTNWKEQKLEYTERKEITDQELDELISDFNSCPVHEFRNRKLHLSTVNRYGCKVGVHPSDKSKVFSYLMPFHTRTSTGDYRVTGFKVRLSDQKKFWCEGRVKDACFFGQQLLPKTSVKRLYIAESPIDAMSVYQAIKDSWKGTKYASNEPNVIGLPHGTGSVVRSFNQNADILSKAEEVILVFDNDKAGNEAVEKAKQLIPNVKVVRLPRKDPNEMLTHGESIQLAKICLFEFTDVKIDGLVDISEIIDDIVKKPEWGLAWPWPTLTNSTYGLRTKEIIGFAGGVGVGKSEFKYQIIEQLVAKCDQTVGVFDLESSVGRTGKAIIGKMLHQVLHKPDQEYDENEVRREAEKLKDKVKLYNHKGVKDWEDIKSAIRHMVVVDNCKFIFIDPLTALVAHLTASDANDRLNTIMSELASLTHELDFTVIYFAHLNPPKTGPSHERGGKVLESQLTGSRAMIKWSHYIFGLERNKDPDLPDYDRNTTTVTQLKDREFGIVVKFRVYWERETGELKELFV